MPATPQHKPKRAMRLFPAICAATLLTLSLAGCGQNGPQDSAKPEAPLAGSTLGGPFTLVDKAGKTVHYADFAGKWRIVYFGYTFCPDVCPLDLQNLMLGYHLFAKAHPKLAARVAPMFITVDPARDTPTVMGQYTGQFGPELIGLTGTPAQIATAAKAFAVFYEKRAGETPGTYLMDHSRAAYLMDPDGKPIALLPVDQKDHAGQAVADELERWVK